MLQGIVIISVSEEMEVALVVTGDCDLHHVQQESQS
jgi:hypothetical protein